MKVEYEIRESDVYAIWLIAEIPAENLVIARIGEKLRGGDKFIGFRDCSEDNIWD